MKWEPGWEKPSLLRNGPNSSFYDFDHQTLLLRIYLTR
jgi:hypothetical protein